MLVLRLGLQPPKVIMSGRRETCERKALRAPWREGSGRRGRRTEFNEGPVFQVPGDGRDQPVGGEVSWSFGCLEGRGESHPVTGVDQDLRRGRTATARCGAAGGTGLCPPAAVSAGACTGHTRPAPGGHCTL